MQIRVRKPTVFSSPSLAIVACLIVVSFLVLLIYDYSGNRQTAANKAHRSLVLSLNDKIAETLYWRSELKQNARLVEEIPFFAEQVQQFATGTASETELLIWMQSLKENLYYDYVRLVDPTGRVLLSVTDSPAVLPSNGKSLLEQALTSREVILSDIYLTDNTAEPIISLFVPLFLTNQANSPIGAMVFCMSPVKPLHHIIANQPTASTSIETYLIRIGDQSPITLPELPNKQDDSPTYTFNKEQILAAIAATEQGTPFQSDDGVSQFLIAARQVGGTPWVMIAKLNLDEVYAPVRQRFWNTLAIAVSLFLVGGGALALFWNKRQSQLLRRQLQMEAQSNILSQRNEHLMRHANDAILLIDCNTKLVREANQRAEAIYGYGRDELLGLSAEVLRSPEESDKLNGLIEQLVLEHGLMYETMHRRKAGAMFPVEISARYIQIEGRDFLQAIVRDITQRKTDEEKISRLNRLYSVLIRINEAMVRIKDPKQLCDQVCHIAVEEGLFSLAWVGALSSTTEQIVPFSSWGNQFYLSNIKVSADDSATGIGPTGTAIRSGQFNICNDFETEPRMKPWQAIAKACGIRSCAAFPLRCQDFVGTLTFCCHLPNYFDDKEIRLLNSLAANLSFALESAYVEKQRQKAENSLRRFKLFSEQTQDVILFANQAGQIIEANRAAAIAYGYMREELLALKIGDLVYKQSSCHETLHLNDDNLFETVQGRKDGSFFFAEVSWQRVTIDNEAVSVFVIRDISQRKTAEQQLQYISTHDALTGLSNRRLLGDYLEQAVEAAKSGTYSSLLLFDIDNFKLINDTHGHAAGDSLLQKFVDIIRQHIREYDKIARLSGDEFAIILHGLTTESVKAFAEALRRTVEQAEIHINGECDPVSVSISIGVAYIDGELDSQKLLSHADFALHAAKSKGRNRVIFAKREEISLERLSEAGKVLAALKSALKENGFVLFYQPVIRTDNGNVMHYEALIRLKDADGSLISPSMFIPIAETFGLMPHIDRWVVEQVITKLQAYPELKIFANISGVSFGDEDLCNYIKTAIKSSGIEPSRIGFEITETATVADLATASSWIAELRELGCAFALDDFGIGFSSFSYVSHFPVDYIKIDGSYVRDLDENKQHQAIVGAIVQVAQSLGKHVIAEFVENEQVLQLLREMGVTCAQGYHTGRPSPWLPGDFD